MTYHGDQELIDYDHLEIEEPNLGLLSTEALKLGVGAAPDGAVSSISTTGFADIHH